MNPEVVKMKPVYLSIQTKETGNRIKKLLNQRGYTVKDVQEVFGFEYPQAVYKWLSGKSLPSVDNLVILSKILNTSIDDILVVSDKTECIHNISGIKSGVIFLWVKSQNSQNKQCSYVKEYSRKNKVKPSVQ